MEERDSSLGQQAYKVIIRYPDTNRVETNLPMPGPKIA